ncbi:guanosine-5'-triphosphate,3'-diphosphate pyrophosphatase [Pseudocolwellia sp. AS88]|uniref:Ppx/GppA phosphatase family protein n=1 Tax=Pseudocolwellia TaxID=2848177 RepID=UPI0026F34184|nr:guanosine-5'-triphosphate,3'-diphosphate pyrophosphatase [Pseudocolwellia sp. AS88]MDO7083818.1 guanosine-5'-triphosphate,3'-diphosphate pyrophosphatase [Pseudocolwellia sp. AS88]
MTMSPLYAVIDLGSNSFHMLITRLVANSVQTVDRVKRKVRLASGLNNENELSNEAMLRGLECLNFFAERLQDIPPDNIRIVATATLRLATNSQEFISKAEIVLGHKIVVLSGLQEAETIYLGVAHTSASEDKRLVIDIGGASTELIVGNAFDAIKVCSVDMGCVTYNQQFFIGGELSKNNMDNAKNAAKAMLAPIVHEYKDVGWQSVLSGSGTIQALAEILRASHQPAIVSLPFLYSLETALINSKNIDNIAITGLTIERQPVFASGLAILIAIFESLDLIELQLSSGALREGLLYEMLPDMRQINIRQRTVNSIAERFHVDKEHAFRVSNQAQVIFDIFAQQLPLEKDNSFKLLLASCALHEIGLLLEFKNQQEHGAYMIANSDLPGFDQVDKQLLATLIQLQKSNIDLIKLKEQTATSYENACYLLIILRLAIIFCQRRNDNELSAININISNRNISFQLPQRWIKAHPLIIDELTQESLYLGVLGMSLTVLDDLNLE